ncbi:MAG TPA: hypothetical protein VEO96_07495 [Thermoplasmata archaeon]|nr:hypothetical protein [Thermoplasmata archaeon]
MRSIAALLGVLLLLALAPVAAQDGTVNAPLLTPRDTWTYRTNTSLAADFFLDGKVTLTVKDRGTFTVEGTPYDAYRIDVSGSGIAAGNLTSDLVSAPASGAWVLTAEETIETKGMKTIASVLDLEANGTLHTIPIPFPFHLRVQNTSAYRLVDDPWLFPLSVGATGVVRTELNFTEDFGISIGFPTPPIHSTGLAWTNLTYTLEAQAVVDTPAGHFDAFRIRRAFPDGTYDRQFFAPAAGNNARTEMYNGTGTEPIATTELVSYRYQALEPARFVGLTTSDWAIVLVVVAAAVVVMIVLRQRLRRPVPPPGTSPPPPPVGP